LPRGKESGLKQVGRILGNVPDIAFIHFTAEDVVRHPLVQKIVAAYAREEAEDERRREGE
jgi:phosphate starvation-inducible PhoH-like protein